MAGVECIDDTRADTPGPAILSAKDPDPLVFVRVFTEDRRSLVRRSVVDDDPAPGQDTLCKNGIEGPADELRLVAAGRYQYVAWLVRQLHPSAGQRSSPGRGTYASGRFEMVVMVGAVSRRPAAPCRGLYGSRNVIRLSRERFFNHTSNRRPRPSLRVRAALGGRLSTLEPSLAGARGGVRSLHPWLSSIRSPHIPGGPDEEGRESERRHPRGSGHRDGRKSISPTSVLPRSGERQALDVAARHCRRAFWLTSCRDSGRSCVEFSATFVVDISSCRGTCRQSGLPVA